MFPTDPILPQGWTSIELAIAADTLTKEHVSPQRAAIVVQAVVRAARAVPRSKGFDTMLTLAGVLLLARHFPSLGGAPRVEQAQNDSE